MESGLMLGEAQRETEVKHPRTCLNKGLADCKPIIQTGHCPMFIENRIKEENERNEQKQRTLKKRTWPRGQGIGFKVFPRKKGKTTISPKGGRKRKEEARECSLFTREKNQEFCKRNSYNSKENDSESWKEVQAKKSIR